MKKKSHLTIHKSQNKMIDTFEIKYEKKSTVRIKIMYHHFNHFFIIIL